MRNIYIPLCVAAACLVLPACAMTKSAVDPQSQVSVTRSFKDGTAARAIKARMLRVEGFDLNDVDVDVINGVVLLSGAAPRDVDKVEAERIAWSAPGVSNVGNEIYIGESLGLGGKTRDELIETSVQTRMATSNNVRNLNYTVATRNSVVYLMGVARNETELAEAARLASITRGVKGVVSYVTLADDMPNSYAGQRPNVVAGGSPYMSQSTSQAYTPPAPSYTAPSEGEDLSYWGEPIADTAPPSASGAPMSAPIDPNAPLPFRPGGGTELDPDALSSGEPIYRDPYTGEIIELPPGTKVVPYQPSTPGGLGAGGTPPPGFAALDNGGNVIAVATEFKPIEATETRTVTFTPVEPLAAPDSIEPTPVYVPQHAPQANVIWDGEKWVIAQ